MKLEYEVNITSSQLMKKFALTAKYQGPIFIFFFSFGKSFEELKFVFHDAK